MEQTDPAQVVLPFVRPSTAVVMQTGPWEVPVELVMAVAPDFLLATIKARKVRGQFALPTAQVVARGKRFWATVRFHGASDVFLPINAYAVENQP